MTPGPDTGETPGLIDEAIRAANGGDVEYARDIAAEVLRRDPYNRDAQSLVDQKHWPPGELRQLTLLFSDLVDSTGMSRRVDVGTYRRILGAYADICSEVVEEHGGAICRRTGDGVLALFGHPRSHEDDTRRAVQAGLALLDRIDAARSEFEATCGERMSARVAIHHGLVHLDLPDSQVYGLAPNLASRLQGLAEPGTLVVSDEVLDIVGRLFDVESHEPRPVKGLDAPVRYHTVRAELPATPQRGRSWLPPFVGRVSERERIREVTTNPDGGSVVVVSGEPGIGKSRLVSEVLGELGKEMFRRTARFLCSPEKMSMDFALAGSFLHLDETAPPPQDPLARLQNLERDLETLGVHDGDLLSLLAPLLRIAPEVGYRPVATDITKVHGQILDALRTWLTALGSTGPVLLQCEDIQWADSSSIELIGGLARTAIPGVRVLATERDDSSRLVGRGVEIIELEPLTPAESAEMARLLDESAGSDRVDAAVRRSEGNPFFLQELFLASRLEQSGERGDVDSAEDPTVVPSVLYEPLLARLYAPAVDVGLAQVAATIGNDFDTDILTAATRRPKTAVRRGVHSLVEGGIVTEDGHGSEYSFRHSLIRDLAYELQPQDVRAQVHGRVGEALRAKRDSGAPVSWTVIAGHFDRARRADDAIHAFQAAADGARDRGGLAQGREHLSSALDLLETTPLDRQRELREVGLRLKRGYLAVSSAGYGDPEAAADYRRCLDLVRRLDAGHELQSTLLSLWGYHCVHADLDIAELMSLEYGQFGAEQAVEADWGLGMISFFRGDFAEADRKLAREPLKRSVGDEWERSTRWELPHEPTAVMPAHRAAARWQRGDVSGFHKGMRQSLARASQLPFPEGPFSTAYSLSYQAWIGGEMRQFDWAEERVAQLTSVATKHGFDFWTVTAALNGAILAGRRQIADGSPDPDAIAQHAAVVSGSTLAWKMVEARVLLPYVITALGEFQAATGQSEEALRTFAESLELSGETGSAFYDAETRRIRARVMRTLGLDGADDELEAARRLAHDQGSVPFETRALVDQRNLDLPVEDPAGLLDDPAALEAAGLREPSRDPAIPR